MAKKDGKTIFIQKGSTTIVGQISGELSMSSDEIDTTTKDSTNGAKEFLPGETSGTVSVEGLYDPAAAEGVSEAITALTAGTTFTFWIGSVATGEQGWEGTGFFTELVLAAPKNEAATYNGTIRLTGELTEKVYS